MIDFGLICDRVFLVIKVVRFEGGTATLKQLKPSLGGACLPGEGFLFVDKL